MCTPKAVRHPRAKFMRSVSRLTKTRSPSETVAVSGESGVLRARICREFATRLAHTRHCRTGFRNANPDGIGRRKTTRSRPFATRLGDSIHPIDPQLGRLLVSGEDGPLPIRLVLVPPCFVVQLACQGVPVAHILCT